jgi:hypothetical protein
MTEGPGPAREAKTGTVCREGGLGVFDRRQIRPPLPSIQTRKIGPLAWMITVRSVMIIFQLT